MTPEKNRRREPDGANGSPVLSGVPVREHDVEPVNGIHWVAWLLRGCAVLLFVLMVLQIALGLTSAVDISYGVLFAEVVRLLIFAALLWGMGAIADLFVKSHHDLRATRVLLARIAYRLRETAGEPSSPPSDRVERERDDAAYRH